MKKFISVLLSVVMMMSVLSASAYAAVVNPDNGRVGLMYENSDTFTSSLSYKGGIATCKSTVILAQNEKWISITQTLEKKSSSGSWSSTGNVWSISASKDSNYYLFSNSKSLNVAGEYHLKSVIVVKNSSGKQETITKYSDSITVN
ncbi:MAG: hypothetical protein HDT46_02070 [Ruminococcaceae bacterium]|nr:hypothetical protein [Oscillospiraceae bacterium]